jgi:molecular chaperone GrpE
LHRTLFGSKSEPKGEDNAAPSPPPQPDHQEEDGISEAEKKLMSENEKLLEKVKEIDDKFKRALAEAENSRIRMRKQVEDAKIFGIQNFCKDLLDVADVLEKAVETVPKDQLATNEPLNSLYTGVQMTEKELQSVFRRHGLLRMNPVGEKFNPNEHHALFESVIEGKEPGTVAVVTKIGYKLHDRTIRPAMVGVVKAAAS